MCVLKDRYPVDWDEERKQRTERYFLSQMIFKFFTISHFARFDRSERSKSELLLSALGGIKYLSKYTYSSNPTHLCAMNQT